MESKGFTIIEMLVALGIFSMLLIATTVAFGNGYASQRKILEMQAVQRDGAYLMEIMSREIRMASGTDGMNPGSAAYYLNFVNHDNKNVTYCRANANGICAGSGEYFAMINNNTGIRNIMNSSSVKVANLMFYSHVGNYNTDTEPMVTISMTLQSTKDASVQMTLQTSVAMRLYYRH